MLSSSHNECVTTQADVEGEHHITNLLVKGEPSVSNHNEDDVRGNNFNDSNDNISILGAISDTEEIFEDAHLEFDPTFPPMDK